MVMRMPLCQRHGPSRIVREKSPNAPRLRNVEKNERQGLHFGAERSTSTLEIPRHFSSAAVTMFMLAELFSKLLPS